VASVRSSSSSARRAALRSVRTNHHGHDTCTIAFQTRPTAAREGVKRRGLGIEVGQLSKRLVPAFSKQVVHDLRHRLLHVFMRRVLAPAALDDEKA
jgi:hypothetical protein